MAHSSVSNIGSPELYTGDTDKTGSFVAHPNKL